MTRFRAVCVVVLLAALACGVRDGRSQFVSDQIGGADGVWSVKERVALQSLALASLPPLPADPSNRYADLPAAQRFGARLFFDTLLSANGRVACATCHQPALDFQDGRALSKGVGTTGRRAMPIAGTAYSPWQFWDGRADSQWAQALGPLESAVEHGGTRAQYADAIRTRYATEYRAVFGADPAAVDVDRVFVNMGKAIAAFERQIAFTPSRFDRFVAVELSNAEHTDASRFTADERAGLRLFIGKAQCETCHNGPRFTDDHFHNIGVPGAAKGSPHDSGRVAGVRLALAGEFNCLSRYSDATPDDCAELAFASVDDPELRGAFKTPSLRNVIGRAPYMHAGQLSTLDDVIEHYGRAPSAVIGHSELKSLRLSDKERAQLIAFLRTLVSPISYPHLEQH